MIWAFKVIGNVIVMICDQALVSIVTPVESTIFQVNDTAKADEAILGSCTPPIVVCRLNIWLSVS